MSRFVFVRVESSWSMNQLTALDPNKPLSQQEVLTHAQTILESGSANPLSKSKKRQTLNITGGVTPHGIRVLLSGNPFDVVYPKNIWK